MKITLQECLEYAKGEFSYPHFRYDQEYGSIINSEKFEKSILDCLNKIIEKFGKDFDIEQDGNDDFVEDYLDSLFFDKYIDSNTVIRVLTMIIQPRVRYFNSGENVEYKTLESFGKKVHEDKIISIALNHCNIDGLHVFPKDEFPTKQHCLDYIINKVIDIENKSVFRENWKSDGIKVPRKSVRINTIEADIQRERYKEYYENGGQ